MRSRFFNIHIFAMLHRPNAGQSMPVIRSGNGNDVQRRVIKRPPHIRDELGLATLPLAHGRRLRQTQLLIGIYNVSDFGMRVVHK